MFEETREGGISDLLSCQIYISLYSILPHAAWMSFMERRVMYYTDFSTLWEIVLVFDTCIYLFVSFPLHSTISDDLW